MKKIDNWLGIQRYMTEATQTIPVIETGDVEIWGRIKKGRHISRKHYRFFSSSSNNSFV